jgi:hypothetical protein
MNIAMGVAALVHWDSVAEVPSEFSVSSSVKQLWLEAQELTIWPTRYTVPEGAVAMETTGAFPTFGHVVAIANVTGSREIAIEYPMDDPFA